MKVSGWWQWGPVAFGSTLYLPVRVQGAPLHTFCLIRFQTLQFSLQICARGCVVDVLSVACAVKELLGRWGWASALDWVPGKDVCGGLRNEVLTLYAYMPICLYACMRALGLVWPRLGCWHSSICCGIFHICHDLSEIRAHVAHSVRLQQQLAMGGIQNPAWVGSKQATELEGLGYGGVPRVASGLAATSLRSRMLSD